MNKEVLEFLRVHIPIILDTNTGTLEFDKTNMYYITREYILKLEKKLKEVTSGNTK